MSDVMRSKHSKAKPLSLLAPRSISSRPVSSKLEKVYDDLLGLVAMLFTSQRAKFRNSQQQLYSINKGQSPESSGCLSRLYVLFRLIPLK
eukprot:6174153-Pleurochrysis_carterae.AAC.2